MLGIARRLLGTKAAHEGPSWLLLDLLPHEQDLPPNRYAVGPYIVGIEQRAERRDYSVGLAARYIELLPRIRWCVAKLKEQAELNFEEPTWEGVFGHLLVQARLLLGQEEPWLAELAVLEALGLSRLAAYVLDDKVLEVYVDAPSRPAYLDHLKYGRCDTQHVLEQKERNALCLLLEAFSDTAYSYRTPSLKGELALLGRRLRLALDLYPLSYSGFSLSLRKLGLAQLSLLDLCEQGFLSLEAAALLLAGLELGASLVIVGPTGSGKTSLLNCLDPFLPRDLRRLYIEDVVETNDLLDLGYRQVKLQVEPMEGWARSRSKADEVIKALHKNPDLIVLGEIQTAEHSAAFFHALAAGVQVIATFHSSGCEQALRRWEKVHRIPPSLLLELPLLVGLRKEGQGQRRQLFEICVPVEREGIALKRLFARSPAGKLEGGLDLAPLAAKLRLPESHIASRVQEIRRALSFCAAQGVKGLRELTACYWRARAMPSMLLPERHGL